MKKKKILRILTKKDIYCSFANYEEEIEEDFPFDCLLIDSDLGNKVEMALRGNENIINCDEYKLFHHFGNEKLVDYLLMYTNVKIEYEEKDYYVIRKIIKLKKNMNK